MFDPLCKLRPRPGSPPSSNGRGLFLRGVRGLRRQFLATAAAPQIAPLPGSPHRLRQWQPRTNVWRKATNPAQGAKRL